MAANVQKTHQEIEIDRETFFNRTEALKILLYRDYALGKQPKTLTTEQQQLLEGILGNEFCDNVCHQILAEDSDRLELLRFNVESDDTVSGWLDDWWTRTNLDDESGETHYAALRDGNYAVSLSWSDEYQRVCLHREPWWNGNVGVFVAYDAVGEPLYAVKDWDALIDGIAARRRIVWYEDRLERYVSFGGGVLGFQPYTLPGEGDHIMPWAKADGSPLHIPIVHFANAGRGPANYGTSELAGGVLGFQDQINDLQYDITAAARLTAFQQISATGVGESVDEDGNKIPLVIGAGKIYRSENDNARFGVLPAGDMSQLIDVYMQKMRSVSRMTRTPLHTITGGDWPSGKALERSEMPLVQKCSRQIKKFTAAWSTVAHRATEIANVYAKANLNEDAIISVEFADPNRPDKTQLAVENLEFWKAAYQAALAGYPVDLYLKREGWKNDEIAEYLQRVKELQSAQGAILPVTQAAAVAPGATAAVSQAASK